VEAFYSSGMKYENPHAREIEALIRNNSAALPLDSVLDLACGTGLVTSVLKELGHSKVIGIDPFLNEEYTVRSVGYCVRIIGYQ
jgi:predicted RNA methylase